MKSDVREKLGVKYSVCECLQSGVSFDSMCDWDDQDGKFRLCPITGIRTHCTGTKRVLHTLTGFPQERSRALMHTRVFVRTQIRVNIRARAPARTHTHRHRHTYRHRHRHRHTHTRARARAHTHTHTHTYTHTRTHTCARARTHARTHKNTYTRAHARAHLAHLTSRTSPTHTQAEKEREGGELLI